MPLYKATKIVLVLKKGGKNPIPCLFIIEGNNYSNLTNQSSVCCARLQNKLQTLFLGVQNHVLCLSIIEGKISQQLDKSKFGLLCKPTRIVTAFSFTRLKTMLPVSLY